MSRFRCLALAAGLLCAACAQPDPDFYAVEPSQLAGATAPSRYAGAVAVGTVSGFSEQSGLGLLPGLPVTQAEFAEALTLSLQRTGFASADPGSARYLLDAQLVHVDHPTLWAGLETTATVHLLYTLRDSKTGAVAFSTPVSSLYTAKATGFGEALGAAVEAGYYNAVDPDGLGTSATARLQTQVNAQPAEPTGLAAEGPGPLDASARVQFAASNALRRNVAQFFAWMVGGASADAVSGSSSLPTGALPGVGSGYWRPGYYVGGVLHQR